MQIGRVSSQLADHIETAIMKDAKIPWFLETGTCYPSPDDPAIILSENTGEGPQLVRPILYDYEFEGDTWIYYSFCRPILKELDLDEELLSRAKINGLLSYHTINMLVGQILITNQTFITVISINK